jgi:hypothetical protein
MLLVELLMFLVKGMLVATVVLRNIQVMAVVAVVVLAVQVVLVLVATQVMVAQD